MRDADEYDGSMQQYRAWLADQDPEFALLI